MSVNNENATAAPGQTTVVEHQDAGGVYASLFEKINLSPVSGLSDINIWQDDAAMADASADERVTAAVQVLLQRLKTSGQQVGNPSFTASSPTSTAATASSGATKSVC